MHRLRLATPDDTGAVLTVLNSAVAWLHQRGIEQWGGVPWRADELLPDLHAGGFYLAETVERVPVATMCLNATPDADFWTDDDDPSDALYLRRLALDRRAAGHGIGAWMLHQAGALFQRSTTAAGVTRLTEFIDPDAGGVPFPA